MPHSLLRSLALGLVLLTSACTQLPVKGDLDAQVNHQLALGQFTQAIALVQGSGLDKKQQAVYIKRIHKTRRQVQADIRQGRSEVEDLIDNDQWQQAQLRLQKLRSQYPQNQELKRYQKEVQRRHKTRGLVLDAQFVVTQLELTQQNKQNYIQRARVDNRTPETVYYDQAMRRYSQRLANIALKLAKADELVLAKQFSIIANKAYDSDYIHKRHATILALIQERSGALLANMEQDFAQALENGELGRARDLINRMLFLAPDNKHYQAQQRQLEQQIRAQVSGLLAQGQRYYTHGDIDQAITVWQQALRLDPDNKELKSLLNHAYKARANVERIRKQQEQ